MSRTFQCFLAHSQQYRVLQPVAERAHHGKPHGSLVVPGQPPWRTFSEAACVSPSPEQSPGVQRYAWGTEF